MIRRVFRTLVDLGYNDAVLDETETDDIEQAEIITSEIDEYLVGGPPAILSRVDEHAPVLDIDFPAAVYPSTTPGKFHLWLDKRIPHDKYMDLLDSLADAGLIEQGYADVSKKRGYTAVRLPWIEKLGD